MAKPSPKIFAAFSLLFTLVLSGCDEVPDRTGPVQTTAVSLDKNGLDHLNLELNMAAGELVLAGGTSKLIDGTFRFNVSAWRPVVRNSVNGSHDILTIEQPKDSFRTGGGDNKWNLQLNEHVVLDLAVNCGAGQARMDLGSLDLRQVRVRLGAGQVDLDLQGNPKHDYEVDIEGGVGQATIQLPANVGAWAEARGALGNINVTGLTKKGDHYENDLYDSAKVNVRLKVHGAIGEIRIVG